MLLRADLIKRKLVFAEHILPNLSASLERVKDAFTPLNNPGGRNPYTYFAGEKTEAPMSLSN